MNVPMFVIGVMLIAGAIIGYQWWKRLEKNVPQNVDWWT